MLRNDNVPRHILIDFSLTVKAATLIFTSGRGSAISLAKEGKFGTGLISFLSRANVRAFHESPDRIYKCTCMY